MNLTIHTFSVILVKEVIPIELDTNNRSVFSLHYHLVLVVKYRKKVINSEVSEAIREIFSNIAPNYHIEVEEWNHDTDHVHVLFKANPKTDLVKFLNSFKSASSRIVKKEYPQIKEKLWKESFWTKSYCLITTGGASIETIRKYIEKQGGN